MKNIISRLESALAGYDFFQEKQLCERTSAMHRFKSALSEARKYYNERRQLRIVPELIHESWQQNISSLESYFVNAMDENFMSNEVINGTMVFTNREAHKLELKYISETIGKKTVEEIISKNLNSAFLSGKSRRSTLINSTHHLYHLLQFEQKTGRKIRSIESVVEFGGGYGNMSRIVRNMGVCNTYTIVDLLLFSCIQYVFLSTVTVNERLAFYDESSSREAKILLHPLFRADTSTSLRGELFLSTWALSESTRATFEWVVSCDWFGATNLLLAYNELWKPWQENELEESLTTNGWQVIKEAITFLPGSYYLFATR
jgi:hypothetical protein